MWEIDNHLKAELEEYDEDLVSDADFEVEQDILEFLGRY